MGEPSRRTLLRRVGGDGGHPGSAVGADRWPVVLVHGYGDTGETAWWRRLIVSIAIVFVTVSCERLVRGPKPTNRDSPAVQSCNDHYQTSEDALYRRLTAFQRPVRNRP